MSDDIRNLAMNDAAMAERKGVDLNPFSTVSSRHLWQLGFDGEALPDINQIGSFNWRAWERGRIARLLLDERKGGAA